MKKGIAKVLEWMDFEPDEEYCAITTRIYDDYLAGRQAHLVEDIKAAAWSRKFLG